MLEGIETDDASSISVVNEEKYIQHNPQTHSESDGLAALFKRLSKTSTKVNIVRIFQGGNLVFAHTEYTEHSPDVGDDLANLEHLFSDSTGDNQKTIRLRNFTEYSLRGILYCRCVKDILALFYHRFLTYIDYTMEKLLSTGVQPKQ